MPELVWDYDFFFRQGNYLSPLSALLDPGEFLPTNDEHHILQLAGSAFYLVYKLDLPGQS